MDLSSYTKIYLRSTGASDSNSGLSAGTPLATAQKAFEIAYTHGGNCVINLDAYTFSGVNLNTAFTNVGATSWPARIAIQGVSETTSSLGGITGIGSNEVLDGSDSSTLIPASASPSITIVGDRTVNLGSISCTGGDLLIGGIDNLSVSGSGGVVTITDLKAVTIVVLSGTGDARSSESFGSAGIVNLTNSSVSSITANGRNWLGDGNSGYTIAGSGGSIFLDNSVVSTINVLGGDISDSSPSTGGNGGSVSLSTSSIVTTINLGGGNGIASAGQSGQATITDSVATTINGVGGSSYDRGSVGGHVTLMRATVTTINCSGSTGTNLSASGGSVVATDSVIIGNIYVNGGPTYSYDGGATGGSVILTNCQADSVTVAGGPGGNGGSISILGGSFVLNTVDASGGGGIPQGSYVAGSGGTISIESSNTGNILLNGGDAVSGGYGSGGNGGSATLIGAICGTISSIGGTSSPDVGGYGGTVSVTDSTCSHIYSSGSFGWNQGGSAGTITILRSTTGDVSSTGGLGDAIGGSGNTISIIDSTCQSVISIGGSTVSGGQSGNSGNISLLRSSVGIVSVDGTSDVYYSGYAGNIILDATTSSSSILARAGSSSTQAPSPAGTIIVRNRSVALDVYAQGQALVQGNSVSGGVITIDNSSVLSTDVSNANDPVGEEGSIILKDKAICPTCRGNIFIRGKFFFRQSHVLIGKLDLSQFTPADILQTNL